MLSCRFFWTIAIQLNLELTCVRCPLLHWLPVMLNCPWEEMLFIGIQMEDQVWSPAIALWYLETWLTRPPDLGFAVSLAVPPLQMLTVPLLISLLRISSSSSSGLYCDDMPCALYHMLFAVVKGGKTLSGDVQIRSRKSVLLILEHSFREDQRMLLTAHSSDSTNSLFKARTTTHRH